MKKQEHRTVWVILLMSNEMNTLKYNNSRNLNTACVDNRQYREALGKFGLKGALYQKVSCFVELDIKNLNISRSKIALFS